MGYWIELHCDTPPEEQPKPFWTDHGHRACANHSQNHPGVSAITFKRGGPRLHQEARRAGYKRTTARGWQCPFCLVYRPKR